MALGYGFQGSFLCKMLLQPGRKMSGKERCGKEQEQLPDVEEQCFGFRIEGILISDIHK